ncbi:TPA: hypothetical protein PJS98_002731 [Staphylococcus aureus]|uniref:hypothetical protein n=2 Tax=Staphylococcus aureus TaxID=1280 RepID=UPI00044E420D|nr:hypothetical protein [Staphylococcus aureus]KAH51880.1 hypothetical protein W706_02713 [Staphylococcus aureus VET1851R]EZZ32306.1 hypothetical protein V115_02813 [Staphylococcus aureus Tur-12]KAB90691.1 hypothetical protein W489_02640 [Staphylococcus aureus VET0190R]HBI1251928.1 hypothetical protein [Staphylococcus aureus]HCU7745055.1 hypothetical protein [Staphylococcus aureus]
MLSKSATKVLKKLKDKENSYQKKQSNTAKMSYDEIKLLFPNRSYISLTMLLKYLLHEHYIYNHISGKESDFDIDDLIRKDKIKLVIGEKGISYLEHRKFVLMAKIIPMVISGISLLLSIINLMFFK